MRSAVCPLRRSNIIYNWIPTRMPLRRPQLLTGYFISGKAGSRAWENKDCCKTLLYHVTLSLLISHSIHFSLIPSRAARRSSCTRLYYHIPLGDLLFRRISGFERVVKMSFRELAQYLASAGNDAAEMSGAVIPRLWSERTTAIENSSNKVQALPSSSSPFQSASRC